MINIYKSEKKSRNIIDYSNNADKISWLNNNKPDFNYLNWAKF